jgi:hypothetical protein
MSRTTHSMHGKTVLITGGIGRAAVGVLKNTVPWLEGVPKR